MSKGKPTATQLAWLIDDIWWLKCHCGEELGFDLTLTSLRKNAPEVDWLDVLLKICQIPKEELEALSERGNLTIDDIEATLVASTIDTKLGWNWSW